MVRDSYWRINDMPIDGHSGSEQVHTYGGGYSLEVWLTAASDSLAGAWPGFYERYQELLRYQNFAGSFALYELDSGRVGFSETHSGSTDLPNGSLLVALRPPAGQKCGRGGWFLVASFEDMTMHPDRLCRVDLGLTFVAPLDEYRTHAEAHDALAAGGI